MSARKIDTGTDLSLRVESDMVSLFYISEPNSLKIKSVLIIIFGFAIAKSI